MMAIIDLVERLNGRSGQNEVVGLCGVLESRPGLEIRSVVQEGFHVAVELLDLHPSTEFDEFDELSEGR